MRILLEHNGWTKPFTLSAKLREVIIYWFVDNSINDHRTVTLCFRPTGKITEGGLPIWKVL